MLSVRSCLAASAALTCTVINGVHAFPTAQGERASTSSKYDFVIVGGKQFLDLPIAGIFIEVLQEALLDAMGVRLSEDASTNVLVLEAGPFPEVIKPYMTPGASQQVLGTELDWGFTTPAQESLGNRTITYHRGRGVGGSTLINGLTYGRGSSSVYNLWQAMGNDGWDWQSVLPYFKKSTSFIPVDAAPYQTYDPNAYSTTGPISLSYPTYVYDSSTSFIRALDAINVSTVLDLNLGDNIGTKQEPLVLNQKQQRVSSYDGYYKPVQGRSNLSVKDMAQVQQIIVEKSGGTTKATGVVYTDLTLGNTLNVTACKEVILSAGVFQTPQLLMLSGIGPSETLSNFGIPSYVINENIGRNMQDHFYFSVIARTKASASASQLYNRVDLLQAAQAVYTANNSGPLTTPVGPTYGFRSLSEGDLAKLGAASALANQTNQAQIEYLWENIYYPSEPSMILPQHPPEKNQSFISLTAALLTPVSRGNVTLQSNTIQDAPVINVNYLESAIEQNFALYMFHSLRNLLAQPEFANYTLGPDHGEVVPGASVTDDATILEYIKSTVLPVWHASGTCRMLPLSEGGVVDSRLRVYGVQNLRVVDASIFHIQGPTYMVAEKAADMIKQDYDLASYRK